MRVSSELQRFICDHPKIAVIQFPTTTMKQYQEEVTLRNIVKDFTFFDVLMTKIKIIAFNLSSIVLVLVYVVFNYIRFVPRHTYPRSLIFVQWSNTLALIFPMIHCYKNSNNQLHFAFNSSLACLAVIELCLGFFVLSSI